MLKIVNSKILVEKLDRLKDRKVTSGAPFGQFLQSSDNLATIIHMDDQVRETGLSVGMQVYFSGTVDKIVVEGRELLVIEAKNVIAINQEDSVDGSK